MAPDPKIIAAFQAMKDLGIPQQKVKPVLKDLLRLYEKNWALIQEENYRVLVDAIFEGEETATEEKKKRGKDVNNDLLEEEENGHEPERPLKRLRLRGREVNQAPELVESRTKGSQVSPSSATRNKGKQPLVAEERSAPFTIPVPVPGKRLISERTSHGVCLKEPMAESERILPKNNVKDAHQLIEPKDEPFTDDMFTDDIPQYEVPIAVIHPDPMRERDIPPESGETNTEIGKESEPAPQCGESTVGDLSSSFGVIKTNREGAPAQDERSCTLDVAASPLGEVKLFLSYNSAVGKRKFRMPTLDAVMKMTEEKCLHSYKITDPKFSVMKLLRHVCESFLELGTDSADESQDHPNGTVHVSSNLDVPNGSVPSDARECDEENADMALQASHEPIATESRVVVTTFEAPAFPSHLDSLHEDVQGSEKTLANALGGSEENIAPASQTLTKPVDTFMEDHVRVCEKTPESGSAVEKDGDLGNSKPTNMCDLMVVSQCERASDDLRFLDDVKDITKGEEWVRIPWINEINYECPSSFRYISQGLVFQNAMLDVSLSRIQDSSCCPTCFGDCLSASVPCVCAQQTGGQFAYTTEGVVKEGFLEDCILMTRDPQHQCLKFCGECPLEKSKNDDCLELCKGHLKRKFIKECWMKCGCSKRCGNRVVQRGITCNLQVFFTSDERGWGLRTLEELPKGTFVCEYVGEILTARESRERSMKSDKHRKDTYVALLDADWGSAGTLKDEKALCLDAAQFGNIARFINHRCLDANLIEIPVEVETPDHHYYHVAFFTTRKVDALEELTWDYGIDFDDHDHPIKPFLCRCGSKFCRNIKRQNRSKSMAIAS